VRREYRQVARRMSLAETLPFRTCARDEECVYALNGCCDCANGGEETAVHRSRLEVFLDHFACDVGTCTDKDPGMACGTGTAACEQNVCEFHTARKH
jgi:hypothetical protein